MSIPHVPRGFVSCWWLLGQSIHHRSLQWNHQHGWGLLSAWCPPKEPGFPAIPMRVDAGEIRTHGGPSIAHDGTQVSLVMSPIDQTLAQLPTRLEIVCPTNQEAPNSYLWLAIPMRVSCSSKKWDLHRPHKEEHMKWQLLTTTPSYTFF